MAGRLLALTLIAFLAVASALYYFHPWEDFTGLNPFNFVDSFNKAYNPSSPADLSFKVEAPDVITAGETVEIPLTVSNSGKSTAENVEVIVESNVFQVETQSFNVKPGEVKQVSRSFSALDVKGGLYKASFRLRYHSGGMESFSPEAEEYIYVLPAVEICDVGWKADLFNPFGKSSINRGDSTAFHFRVKSSSGTVIYEGITAEVFMKIKLEGLKISPSEVKIGRLGPKGTSEQYVVTVTADDSVPPGQYPIKIQLYTADGKAITGAKASIKLTVTA